MRPQAGRQHVGALATLAAAALALPAVAGAVEVTPGELAEARRWATAKLRGQIEERSVAPGLVVLDNHDPVQRNGRGGRPLRLAGKEHTRGLYCHAASKVLVRLPGPGQKFTATVGVDSNEQTSDGRGSVVFSVVVGGKEAFRSGLLREGMAPVPIAVDLAGATELALEVADGGDGIACDQADWADARVALAGGSEVWLGDLPILDGERAPYSPDPFFSFLYGGKLSGELLEKWELQRSVRDLDAERTEHTLEYLDTATGLAIRCRAIEYHDFPTVEWSLHFKNTAAADTPILSAIQAVDTRFARGAEGEFVLHHHTGSVCAPVDYQPHATPLGPGATKRIATSGGRPTNSDLPYFNIAWPGEGVIAVIGWPGQWAAEFARDESRGLRLRGGQELTHFKLHPGEEVRSPLVVLQFYHGDRVRSQNVWRRWMLAHVLPRPGGKLPTVQMAACSSHQFGEMIHANRENQIAFISRYLEEKLPLDYWWMDAGWYWNKSGWPHTGTWEVDTERFPGGLRSITDFAHARGVKSIVWFEPERVAPDTWLTRNHPEWIIGGEAGGLLNLGDPDARRWLTAHVDGLITSQGIDLYRQDFNMDPLDRWRQSDAADRQGMAEIRHVEGYLAYWDELRRRHPEMLIDTCASGGRRNDLETLRRAVPLLRSDYIIEPVGNQCHTYGIASWIPFHGTGSGAVDAYMLRSVLAPHFTACFDVRRRDLDYDLIRRVLGEWREFAPCYFGDYYPLTPYSLAHDAWMAWQFHRPDPGDGVVQAFRRTESVFRSAELRLHDLDPESFYTVTELDAPQPRVVSGRELMEKGLLIEMVERPAAAVIRYRKLGRVGFDRAGSLPGRGGETLLLDRRGKPEEIPATHDERGA